MHFKTFLTLFTCLFFPFIVLTQSLTTAELFGIVENNEKQKLEDATVGLVHLPSNTTYQTLTRSNGHFYFPNLLSGGPYELSISYVGYENYKAERIDLDLGKNNLFTLRMQEGSEQLAEVEISTPYTINQSSGLSTSIDEKDMEFLPNIQRSILDFTALNPSSNGVGFAGKGSRDNFISIDGSAFNNAYGIGGLLSPLIGNVVGAQPISLDAIEAVQVNVSPFDVRQGGFTGAGIHATTKSGTNDFKATAYSFVQSKRLVGNKIDGQTIEISDFDQNLFGFSLGGPLIKNKLFFFVNYENESLTNPATDFLANRSGLEGDNVTRVQASDLDEISDFLASNYDYETGAYENYNHLTENQKLLLKLNWNLNNDHQLSLRYNQLTASQDFPNTNSGSFGAPNRVDNLNSMSFENSGGIRRVNARSFVAELRSFVRSNMSNKLLVGYSHFPDEREIRGDLFPSVDILNGGQTYISFGSHIFASNNSITQKTINVQNDFSLYFGSNTLTLGFNYEQFQFDYIFTPASSGSFVFQSLEDFYNSTPMGTLTPIGLSNGIGRPSVYSRTYPVLGDDSRQEIHPELVQFGVYAQQEFSFKNISILAGIRMDLSSFPTSPLDNEDVSGLDFQNAMGETENFQTSLLPDSKPLISPRIGFDWAVREKINLHGGTGIFTGRTPIVRIGDQYLNNGLLQGQIKAQNNAANQYPFNSDPNAYIPDDAPAPSSYEMNAIAQNYSMPQLWKSALGVYVGILPKTQFSIDAIYSKELNRDYVRNANLDHINGGTAADGRFVFANSRLNNPPILAAYILDNTSEGEQFNLSLQIKKQYSENWSAMMAYSYTHSLDANSFSASTSRSSFRNLPVLGNSNIPVLTNSDDLQRHRIIANVAFQLKSSTTFSLFLEGAQRGRFSYTYSGNGDVNKDGVPSNDLIFIPENQSQIELEEYTKGGNTISIEDQWAALDRFITGSDYLNENRGEFAERNGGAIPSFLQLNIRILQDINFKISEKKNTIQLSLDIMNFGNLINSSWGNYQIPANLRPIQAMKNNKFRVDPSTLGEEFILDTGILSRWQMRIGVRYIFN
ncbi:MAG: carboxypeptidase-like regulatory domain-containing protein [Bacteroidota bacterium]